MFKGATTRADTPRMHTDDPLSAPAPADGRAPTTPAARVVTVHPGRLVPSAPVAVTPSMATHMAAHPPAAAAGETPLRRTVGPAVVAPQSPDQSIPSSTPLATPDAVADAVAEPGAPAADEPQAATPARRRWWHRLAFWRRATTGTRRPPGATSAGCRLCSWEGPGPCPLGHRSG